MITAWDIKTRMIITREMAVEEVKSPLRTMDTDVREMLFLF